MIIRKVRMVNFRGFLEKTIYFQDKPVVLLTAANGLGKTTTIDAIEWCLTGDIHRLKIAFDTRSTNEPERKLNSPGILKNRYASDKDRVKVFLWLFDGEKESVLCREQVEDELTSKLSVVTLDGDKKAAAVFIREYIGESFYNYHFCDIQKSFNVQSAKRTALNGLFSEFITNYDEQIQIAKSLDTFAEDASRYVLDADKQKVPPAVIANLEKQIAEAREASKQVSYPDTLFYPGEKTDITGMNQQELTAQKDALRNCGYQVAKEALDKLTNNEKLKSQQTVIREIVSYWQTKGSSIQRAVKVGFLKNTDAITALEKKLSTLKGLALSKTTILQNAEAVIALGDSGFTQSDFDADQKEIQEKEKKVKDLSAEIDWLSKNNKMLKLLSSLTNKKQVVIEYRDAAVTENGVVRCPVCGSESFASMDAASILKEAEEYIRQNGETVQVKDAEKALVQADIDALYQKIIHRAEIAVTKETERLATEISDLKVLQDEIQPYFDTVARLQKTSLKISTEELTAEKAEKLLAAVEGALLAESEEQNARTAYQQILTVLGYRSEHESVQQTQARVKKLLTGSYAVSDFSYDMLVSKLNAIDSVLANQKLLDRKHELDECLQKNQGLDEDIRKLQDLQKNASGKAAEIRDTVEKLSKHEYEKVGPALGKFYNKLSRFNAVDGFRLELKKDGISLVDNKDKNIVNVLSNGQISVFLLAYFFAGISVRNDREKMKVYFIDDLTACMDDVNMLAFMDLLKYQMSSKATMEQLFFITCDDRISKLLKYKLSGRGVELCELIEADFAEEGCFMEMKS